MSKDDIIRAVKQSPLNDTELTEIIAACTLVTVSNALIGAGMDLLAARAEEAMDIATENERGSHDSGS